MLGKLSRRNAKRQAKDYIIYFITVTISAALMFSFNSLATSKDISELSISMKDFSKVINIISILIVIIMAWLINYTMKFMLEKRSKEFGTYQLLGIEKKDIANMYTLENIIIGIFAFIIGVFGGIFLYQIFTSVIMNIFDQPYGIQITFNIDALKTTAIYFFGIFILVLLNSRRKIRKTKIYDLLYADKKNENNIIKSAKGNMLLFIISIILLISALMVTKGNFESGGEVTINKILISIILLIIGLYSFYISISNFIIKIFLDNKKRKYKNDNMFLYRNLTSKINTMSITIGTIAFMFTIILIGGNVALLLNNMLNNEIEMSYPFEIMISGSDRDFSNYKEYISKNATVKAMHEYAIYQIPETGMRKAFNDTSFEGNYSTEKDEVMSFSDYNRLREILGYEKVSLDNNQVIIQCMETAKSIFENYIKDNNKVQIMDKEFNIKEVRGENLAQTGFNGYMYCIVVPDDYFEIIKQKNEEIGINDEESYDFTYKFVAQTEELTNESFYRELRNLIPTKEIQKSVEYEGDIEDYTVEVYLGNVRTKGGRLAETKSFYTIISFLAFYIALIFIMATGTLLAIQSLSDSEKYKYRYNILKKLGMEESQLNKIIFKQLLYFFILPLIVPVIISIIAILYISNIFTIAITIKDVWTNIGIVLGLFLLVYGIYFIATDVQFSRNINGNY